MSNANELSIEASKPEGFDFTGCTISTSGQDIKEIDGSKLRLRVVIIAGKMTLVFFYMGHMLISKSCNQT